MVSRARNEMTDQKPGIIEVVSAYTPLRKSGKEYSGFCPLHSEKTPSFTANEEKGVFYCHGCHAGGDAIRFIELIEGVDFKGALAHLGLADQPKITREKIRKLQTVKRASRNLATWVLSVSAGIGEILRESGQRAHMAQKILKELPEADERLLRATIERATREWEILSTLEEDLLDPKQTATLWEDRETIERLVGDSTTYSDKELEDMFPPITDAPKLRLVRIVRCEA